MNNIHSADMTANLSLAAAGRMRATSASKSYPSESPTASSFSSPDSMQDSSKEKLLQKDELENSDPLLLKKDSSSSSSTRPAPDSEPAPVAKKCRLQTDEDAVHLEHKKANRCSDDIAQELPDVNDDKVFQSLLEVLEYFYDEGLLLTEEDPPKQVNIAHDNMTITATAIDPKLEQEAVFGEWEFDYGNMCRLLDSYVPYDSAEI